MAPASCIVFLRSTTSSNLDARPMVDATPTDPVLLGRALVGSTRPIYRIFGSVATDALDIPGTLANQRAIVQGAGAVRGTMHKSRHRMRRIRSSGIELLRSEQVNVSPLRLGELEAPEDGTQRTPDYSLLVTADTPEGQTIFRMDIGATLDILCGQLSYSVCGPNARLVGPNNESSIERTGIVSDAGIGVSMCCIESADGGHRRVPFSELVAIPQNETLGIYVPSYAREVKVTMVDGTAGGGSWSLWAGGEGGVGNVPILQDGVLDFDAANVVSTDESKDVGGSAILLTDVDANNARIASITWQIEP